MTPEHAELVRLIDGGHTHPIELKQAAAAITALSEENERLDGERRKWMANAEQQHAEIERLSEWCRRFEGAEAERDALQAENERQRALIQKAWGALNYILAFYEPGQTYLDTNAWKQAEARGRLVHAELRAALGEKQ